LKIGDGKTLKQAIQILATINSTQGKNIEGFRTFDRTIDHTC